MADESRRYPPTDRKLARLWEAGVTPASPALVAGAVLVAAAVLALVAGRSLGGWLAGVLRTGLTAAGSPETALEVCASLTCQVAAVIAAMALVPAVIALAVQAVQAGPRGEHRQSEAGMLPASEAAGATSVGGELRRALGMVVLAGVAVGATVRAAILSGTQLVMSAHPLAAAGHVAWTIGGPLALLVLAAAVLDTLLRRADWHAAAWMSRREMEEEARETEGHPLTRERRANRQRRRNA